MKEQIINAVHSVYDSVPLVHSITNFVVMQVSANALLDAVNSLYTRDEFLSAARSFEHEGRGIAEQEKAAGGGLKLGGEPVESIGARRELSDM